MMQNMEQKNCYSINYWYFGFFFALLLLTCTSSILLKDNLSGSRLFFWFYAVGQAAFEVLFLAYLGVWIDRFCGRVGFGIFIGFTFFLLFFHGIDFLMDRILDLSAWSALFVFVFGESFENFYYLLDASGVPFWAWGFFFLLLAILPVLGIFIYKGTLWVSKKKPLMIPNEMFLQMLLCIPGALFLWDHSASKVIPPNAYTEFIKSLPWKRTFFQPETVQLSMKRPLRSPRTSHEFSALLSQVAEQPKKPNIIFLVAESLRGDFVEQNTAPNLTHFKEENIHATISLSSANATHISWFSTFHSEFPFYWKQLQSQNWKLGSPALALFKKLGYKIRVYSSSELHYYGMETLLFGENDHLVDSIQKFPHSSIEPYQSDRICCETLGRDLLNPELQNGQFMIVFLDGTHFNYSWPREQTKFIPFSTELAYFNTFYTKIKIEHICNRYRNAISYLDGLFGKLVPLFPKDALVAFMGDHGEEFFDHGHLFHLSHLVKAQTEIPIYLKIPGIQKTVKQMSQIDILPTLLDGAFGMQSKLLQGESILREKKWPFFVTARFNGGQSPIEFFLHNNMNKLSLQFNNEMIFENTDLRILSLKDANDEPHRFDIQTIESWVRDQFGPALERLFP